MKIDELPTSQRVGEPHARPASSVPGDRSTAFQPVEGGETHNGAVLLVEAYSAIWLFLMGFLVFQWRRQAVLHSRIDDLERAIDRAAARQEAAEKASKVGGKPA